jgi:hypothetical protein
MDDIEFSKSSEYLPRYADALLEKHLQRSGAVQIKGPKWCGKTATAIRACESFVFMQDPDKSSSLIALADSKPSLILEGAKPRLIDEWQMAPKLWDAVRFAVDKTRGRGQFVLTGSATPVEKPAHSGVGRISRMIMRPMSLFESKDSTGAVSLAALFEGNADVAAFTDTDIEQIAYLVCRGGWPEAVSESNPDIAIDMAHMYLEEFLDIDVLEMDEVRRNSNWMRALLRSYARNSAAQTSVKTITEDIGGETPSQGTVSDYIDALKRAYIVEDLEAWNPKLRSKTAVRTSPTRHFVDPSLAAAALGATPKKLLEDFETFGLLFESMCVRDLRIYVESLGGRLYHYRDKSDFEADAVAVLPDGRWGLIEVKLGSRQVESAAKTLKKIADKIDAQAEGGASFLMVLTGAQSAYMREDGVAVVPITCLSA